MNTHPGMTNLANHKKLIIIIISVLALILVVLLTVVYLNRNYLIDRFVPQSRIDFTVYIPNTSNPDTELISSQLIIKNYMVSSASSNSRTAKVVIWNPPAARTITEQKAHGFTPVCKGEFSGKCSVRQTKGGQQYTYTTNADEVKGKLGLVDEWIHFEKNGTDIVIDRYANKDRPMSATDWNNYIDSLQPIPGGQLKKSLFHVGDKEVPFGP